MNPPFGRILQLADYNQTRGGYGLPASLGDAMFVAKAGSWRLDRLTRHEYRGLLGANSSERRANGFCGKCLMVEELRSKFNIAPGKSRSTQDATPSDGVHRFGRDRRVTGVILALR